VNPDYDVLIVGGGPAGLSAALALGRMSRTALLCDDGRPRNERSPHANNLPSQDGIDPSVWRVQARRDLEKYTTLRLFEGSVRSIERRDQVFVAQLSSGIEHSFRKVILAHGVRDKLPSAPGFEELWARSIFHCPYCHGYEVRGERLGLIGNGKFIEHMLPMIVGLSNDVVVFTNGKSELSSVLLERMEKKNVRLVEAKIDALIHDGGKLQAVACDGESPIERDALFAGTTTTVEMKSNLGELLGCEKTEAGHYKMVEFGKTTVAGVFAAGDIATGLQSVLSAAALGQLAGAGAAAELLSEDFSR
jgi:thioredoxin reductase